LPVAHHRLPRLAARDTLAPQQLADGRAAVEAWAAHVAAGRIGVATASTPLQEERRRRAEAALRTGPRHRIW
jgi:hypothetical protein